MMMLDQTKFYRQAELFSDSDSDSATSLSAYHSSQGQHREANQTPHRVAASTKVYYFAFGSNMDATRMRSRGVAYSRRFAATVEGYRLCFNKAAAQPGVGFANIEPVTQAQAGSWVEGIIYETTLASIEKLDRYEGVPTHYYKEEIEVTTKQGKRLTALVYLAQPDKTAPGLLPSREYLDHLLAGKQFLSKAYYQRLVAWEVVAPVSTTTTSTSWSRDWADQSRSGSGTRASRGWSIADEPRRHTNPSSNRPPTFSNSKYYLGSGGRNSGDYSASASASSFGISGGNRNTQALTQLLELLELEPEVELALLEQAVYNEMPVIESRVKPRRKAPGTSATPFGP